MIDDNFRKLCILSNLPKAKEWKVFKTSFELSGKAVIRAKIITRMQSFEVTLRRDSAVVHDPDLCGKKMARDQHPSESSQRGKGFECHGCGEKGHKIRSSPDRYQWAYAEQKDKSDANLTSTLEIDSESYLFSIPTLLNTKASG